MPSLPMIQPFIDHLGHVLIVLMLSGLMGLVISNNTIIFTSFGCAMLLAIFLKNASNPELKYAKPNNESSITVEHINLSLIENDKVLKEIIERDSSIDIYSFQEYTPDWAMIIPKLLKKHNHVIDSIRIDVFGKAIYSTLPLIKDKNGENRHRDICHKLVKNQDTFMLVSTYVQPALDSTSTANAKNHLNDLNVMLNLFGHSNILLLGEFNQVYWSGDLMEFRKKSDLVNSRHDVSINTKVPYNHIFFRGNIECRHFQDVLDKQENQVGCLGTFQIKDRTLL